MSELTISSRLFTPAGLRKESLTRTSISILLLLVKFAGEFVTVKQPFKDSKNKQGDQSIMV